MTRNGISTTEERQPTFEDLELLVEVSQLLTLHDLEEVMNDVMSLAARAVGASKSSLFLYNGDDVEWNYVFTMRNLNGAESIRVVSQVVDKGLAGWVIKNRIGTIIDDTETDDRWHVFPDDDMTVRSAMCAPLMHNRDVIAVLTLVHPEPGVFNNYHLRLLTIIANQATVAIQNTQLVKRLLEKQRQLEAVLHSVPDVLLVLDEAGQFITLNDGARELLNVVNDPVVGQPLMRYSSQLDVLQDLQNAFSEGVAAEEPLSFEMRSYDLERDYVVQVSAWRESTSQRNGTVIIMHDVTTMRDLYRFKDEILKMAGHDLRTPMAIITSYVDMLETDIGHIDPAGEYIKGVYEGIQRVNNLLDNLMQVRQIDEKGLNIQSDDETIIDLVYPVIYGAKMLAEQKNQTIISELLIDETVKGAVDTTLLQQVMENLTTNAVKYTQNGGQIIVRAYEKDACFYFEVEDNGIGIPEESIPHLFESFYRVNPDQNTTVYGAGLGLSFVKSIVERHGGRVWVESEEGVGSLFGLYVPLTRTNTN